MSTCSSTNNKRRSSAHIRFESCFDENSKVIKMKSAKNQCQKARFYLATFSYCRKRPGTNQISYDFHVWLQYLDSTTTRRTESRRSCTTKLTTMILSACNQSRVPSSTKSQRDQRLCCSAFDVILNCNNLSATTDRATNNTAQLGSRTP